MDKKILVSLKQPGSGVSCEVMIPANVAMREVVQSLDIVLRSLSCGAYAGANQMLFNCSANAFVDLSGTANENAIRTGDELMQI